MSFHASSFIKSVVLFTLLVRDLNRLEKIVLLPLLRIEIVEMNNNKKISVLHRSKFTETLYKASLWKGDGF